MASHKGLGFGTALAMLLATGCAKDRPPAETAATGPADWRRVATAADRERLREWRTAFVEALDKARTRNAPEVAAQGRLLEPDAAIPDPDGILAGAYRCRTVTLGAQRPGLLDYVAYPPFDCRIADEGEVASFAKLSGSQRPVGLVFAGDGSRQIFLGTLMLGDETKAIDYGRDAQRDMAGAIERIGPRRWRLILPRPRFESVMDVIELVPAN